MTTTWKWDGTGSTSFPLGVCTSASEVIVEGRDLDETIAAAAKVFQSL